MNDGENYDRRVGSVILCESAARFEPDAAQVRLRHFHRHQAPRPRRAAACRCALLPRLVLVVLCLQSRARKMGRVVPLRLTAATCACRAVSAVSARKLWIAATVETLRFSHSWRT